MTDSVKVMPQILIEADLKFTGEMSQGTEGATQMQGFTITRDGTLGQAEAQQEVAYRLESGDYLYVQTPETGYDYMLYSLDYKELGGSQFDNPSLSLARAGGEVLAIHELSAGTMEPLTGDRMGDFLEVTEQANTTPQPQARNGIDGLLSRNPFMSEAPPADRATAPTVVARQNAPHLGSEERQLIMAYAETVDDTEKVTRLINRLCEQGYETRHGHMDDFMKNQIEGEIIVEKAEQTTVHNPAAEPVVTILQNESPHLKDSQQMPLHETEAVFGTLDSSKCLEWEQSDHAGGWYDKTKFCIDFTMQGQPDNYKERQDFGDDDGSLIEHVQGYHEYYAQDENWKSHVLHHEGPEARETDKAQREMSLYEFVPYIKQRRTLSHMEQETRCLLQPGDSLPSEQTAHLTALVDYVTEHHPLLNQDQYQLPEPPRPSDFDESLQDYKVQVQAEVAQEAEDAGLTVEEYLASDSDASAQPNFSTYQAPRGSEGRDLRYHSYEGLRADGLSVDGKNYQFVYTIPLDQNTPLDEIYHRFNTEHPTNYTGRSLLLGDIVVFWQDGKQIIYYVDSVGHREVPEFLKEQGQPLTPDKLETGEVIQTPGGVFHVTAMDREQMEAVGYGSHHQSEDGQYLITANGIRAFAIPVQHDSRIKTVEMSIEQNEDMIDGILNNTPSMGELGVRAKAGEQVSLPDVAAAVEAEGQTQKQAHKSTKASHNKKKPSIRVQLTAARKEQEKQPPAGEESKDMGVEGHEQV